MNKMTNYSKYYDQKFYSKRHQNTLYSAQRVISILLDKIPTVNSAVDVGCGVGTWLSVLKDKGIDNILGIEGYWVDEELLVIPTNCFQKADLTNIDLTNVSKPYKKYDLTISLEVAEHLPSTCAESFVFKLTELSDYILFSAAIPGQGGASHINEQWQDYWVELFSKFGYEMYDFIRPEIWLDNEIPVWYRQNILLFVKKHNSSNLNIRNSSTSFNNVLTLNNSVHPDLFQIMVKKLEAKNKALKGEISVRDSFKLFLTSLNNYFSRKLERIHQKFKRK